MFMNANLVIDCSSLGIPQFCTVLNLNNKKSFTQSPTKLPSPQNTFLPPFFESDLTLTDPTQGQLLTFSTQAPYL